MVTTTTFTWVGGAGAAVCEYNKPANVPTNRNLETNPWKMLLMISSELHTETYTQLHSYSSNDPNAFESSNI
jgi:hypothetical protein